MPEAAPGRSPSGGRSRGGRGNSSRGRGRGRNRRGRGGGNGKNNGDATTPSKTPSKGNNDSKSTEQQVTAKVIDPVEEKVRLMDDQVSTHLTCVNYLQIIILSYLTL